jgi:putative FmdB family regulatory protein
MPTYSYLCDSCGSGFELFFTIKDYNDSPKCIYCNNKACHRNYHIDFKSQISAIKKSDSELKTLGDLANRNRDRMSDDEKQHLHNKHNEYKENSTSSNLPAGMSKIKKPSKKTKWT